MIPLMEWIIQFVRLPHIGMPTVHSRLNPQSIGQGGCVAAAEAQIVALECIAIEVSAVILFVPTRKAIIPAVQSVGMTELKVSGVHAAGGGADVTAAEQGR